MMLRHAFSADKEADVIETAVVDVLEDGYRTADIFNKSEDDAAKKVGCAEMGRLVTLKLR